VPRDDPHERAGCIGDDEHRVVVAEVSVLFPTASTRLRIAKAAPFEGPAHGRIYIEPLESLEVALVDGTKAHPLGSHDREVRLGAMLLHGINHVATLTSDTERLHAFYREVFEATVEDNDSERGEGFRMSFVNIGDGTVLNVFEIRGNSEAERQVPMFGRGRIDHIGLRAKDFEAFEEIRRRLMARGAADDFVTDFGSDLSVFFRDPDGLEGEVLVENPDAAPGVQNPPGTRAARFPALA
jgi:catechol 2,3-dioxygenase-like lactoylglutathione lyase family enzyme